MDSWNTIRLQFHIIDLYERLVTLLFNFRQEYFTNLCKSSNDKKNFIFPSHEHMLNLYNNLCLFICNRILTRAEAILQYKFLTQKCVSMYLIMKFLTTILWKNSICHLYLVLSLLKDLTFISILGLKSGNSYSTLVMCDY